jgi:tRNA (guanine10-N2)-dimethyltransferase
VEGNVALEEPDREVSVFVGADGVTTYLAITRPGAMRQGWVTRRPRSRAFFHPSAIFPKLSRALVNLSGVQAGEAFLDPYCGTGSLLIEASIIGAEPVGIDLARKMVRGARRNSIKYGQPWLGIVRGDSRRLPIREVGAVATDIPYGRASSAGGLESSEILRSLVEGAEHVLPVGRKLVVMHPKSLEVEEVVGGLRIEEELDIYIHRTLTRTITVMRRDAAS